MHESTYCEAKSILDRAREISQYNLDAGFEIGPDGYPNEPYFSADICQAKAIHVLVPSTGTGSGVRQWYYVCSQHSKWILARVGNIASISLKTNRPQRRRLPSRDTWVSRGTG